MASSIEQLEAEKTRRLSAKVAGGFVAQLGALAPVLLPPFPTATFGRRPGFQATVLDHKYWFAKLYELVTMEELSYARQTAYPGFTLHFIPVFYGMYLDALNAFTRGQLSASTLWFTHFTGPGSTPGREVEPCSMDAVAFSVRTGAIAHIKGDMAPALVKAYTTWREPSKPSFDDLRPDFITKREGAFQRAQARFYLEVNDKIYSPLRPEVGQFAAANLQVLLHVQPSLTMMFEWRQDAWDAASRQL